MRRPDVGEQLPPPILPNGKHQTENLTCVLKWVAVPSVEEITLLPQADLELHSATCANFN